MSLVETPTTHKPDEHTMNKFQTLPQTFDKPLSPKKIESPPNKTESPIFSAKEPNPNDQNKINDLDHTIKKNDSKNETVGGKFILFNYNYLICKYCFI